VGERFEDSQALLTDEVGDGDDHITLLVVMATSTETGGEVSHSAGVPDGEVLVHVCQTG
jgi:hypothetical protein